MNKASAVISEMSTRQRAEKVKAQAREVVELLERARELMVEENAVQLAVEHLNAALREAEGRAAVLENWYQRTYSPAPESLQGPLYCGESGRLDAS